MIKVSSLPSDLRKQQGGRLFLASLSIFFLASLALFFLYAYSRHQVVELGERLPRLFLGSTVLLLVVSGLAHLSTRLVLRDRMLLLFLSLATTTFLATFFVYLQLIAMAQLMDATETAHLGLAGMIVVLAFLHALHVLGGILAMFFVTIGAARGRYDHERHWGVFFAANYWHFLDLVWLCMLIAFALTGLRF